MEITGPEQIAERLQGLRLPRHVAVVMDGNGRWAKSRGEPRHAGHRAGVRSVRELVDAAGRLELEALTLFAFSSENWRRPGAEVRVLMELFRTTLDQELQRLHENDVRLHFIGDRRRFDRSLQRRLTHAEEVTSANRGLQLAIATSYGGRWEIVEAARRLAEEAARGERDPATIDEASLHGALSTTHLPDPDLFIRTGGERRVSNFLLWQLAYTELHFTETLWPDFRAEHLAQAIEDFAGRERRYGGVQPEPLESVRDA